jgi:hypothetical protein
MVVRWLSLFDTIDSVLSQFALLEVILLEQSRLFKQGLTDGENDLHDSRVVLDAHLDEITPRGDMDEDLNDEQPAEGEHKLQDKPKRKLKKGEKASLLLENELFLRFLSEFGQGYHLVIKFFQNTKATISYLCFYEILAFQQSLFNLCLQFTHVVPHASSILQDKQVPEQSLKRTRTKRRRLAEDDEEDLKKHCVCQQPYDFEDEASNGVMIECGLAGACEHSVKWFHIKCVGVKKKKSQQANVVLLSMRD